MHCLRHAAGDGAQRIAVAAYGDGVADGILETRAGERAHKRLRHSALTRGAAACRTIVEAFPRVARPYLIHAHAQVVAKVGGDALRNLLRRHAFARQKDGQRSGLRALDALGVIVGAGGALGRHTKHLGLAVARPAHRTHAHGRAIAATAISRLQTTGARLLYPPHEHATKAAHRARIGYGVIIVILCHLTALEQPLGGGHGENGVVGIGHPGLEDVEILGLDVVELVDAAYGVANNASYHNLVKC